jgi:hypothetical protein
MLHRRTHPAETRRQAPILPNQEAMEQEIPGIHNCKPDILSSDRLRGVDSAQRNQKQNREMPTLQNKGLRNV